MADDDTRAARQRALAEKKRRLEEIKARRKAAAGGGGGGGGGTAADGVGGGAAGGTGGGGGGGSVGLDSYIDDLLKGSTPGLALAAAAAPEAAPAPPAEEEKAEAKEEEEAGEEKAGSTNDSAASAPAPARPAVETFEIAVQCEEDDFPPPSAVDEDEGKDDDDDEDGASGGGPDDEGPPLRGPSAGSVRAPEDATPAAALTEEERSAVLSSPPFASFLSSASKRVERLLGAGDESLYGVLGGSGWGDFSADYAREEEWDDEGDEEDDLADGAAGGGRRRRRKKRSKGKEEAYQAGGFFTARATYEFPKFTRGRNITDIEWCPGHKEWILASYNAVSGPRNLDEAGGAASLAPHDPSTRHISPKDPSSSFLQSASSSAIPPEGLVAIYNLSMPHRPEHAFCAGCPILHARFHPSEGPKLVLGGAASGQVLVWDARVGRYPVQRSGAAGGGHDCELVGMGVLGASAPGAGGAGGGAGGGVSASELVTASSDGLVCYWSPSNLREPAERVKVDANLSCLSILPGDGGDEGVVCGDERGGLHAIRKGTGRDGSGSTKRSARTLHPGGVGAGAGGQGDVPPLADEDADAAALDESEEGGHYGMVTAVAVRPPIASSHSPRGEVATGGSSRGFPRGAAGLMVTTGVDWSTKLWAPAYGCERPLTSFLSGSYDCVCDVQWSPVHPSVFSTASSDGTVHVWNLASSLDQPVSGAEGVPVDRLPVGGTVEAGAAPGGLNRLRWSSDGRRMAVASGDRLHVLGVGEELWKCRGDEEGKVVHNLVSRGLIQE